MARVPIANLKGPKGDRGAQGLPGTNGVPTDQAVATLLGIPSQTASALQTALDGQAVLPEYLTRDAQARTDPRAAYRKRVVHNLVYQHADWAAAEAAWGTLFPQAFTIDETAQELFVISTPGIVSVYDWGTGSYKQCCFRLAGVTVTNQSLVIREEGGRRFLYARRTMTEFARWDITALPTTLTDLQPAGTFAITTLSDFTFWDGVWTIGAATSDLGGTEFSERGKFLQYDEAFNPIGLMHIDAMRYGGAVGGGMYSGSGYPKAQGFAAGPGMFAASVGGGWDSTSPEPITNPYFYQGVRLYSASGEVLADSLVTAETMRDYFTALGYQPNHIEAEGICYTGGHWYSLYAIAASGTPAAATGGIVIMEEFSNHNDAVDFANRAVTWTAPNSNAVAARLHPVVPTRRLSNPVTGGALLTVGEIFDYMRAVGQHRLAFASSVVDVKDGEGNLFGGGALVECMLLTSTTMQVRVTRATNTAIFTWWWNGTAWQWTKSHFTASLTPSTGSGTITATIAGNVVQVQIELSGTFPVGTVTLTANGALPGAMRPTAVARGAAVLDQYAGTAYVSAGGQVGVQHQSGASRTGISATVVYLI
ncbi:hypothetical protein [Microbacterium sp.]|uniref:hypothetical protein n=1 Tax=Microbacterium sp. TaxID=51671 RepID=UPI00281183DB|nr:hypothetical protein [Microbacterium sp.]